MNRMNVGRSFISCGVAALFLVGTTGCATKKHVRGVVAPVEARVGAAEKKSAEQSAAIGELENNVSRTDEKATDAERKAMAAGQDAARANQAATEAGQRADGAANAAKEGTQRAMSRIGEVVENIDNYQHVTTESILFAVNKHGLNKDAKAQLDAAVTNIKNNKNFILEVQGFTDKTGSASSNLALSQKRADAVVRYLTVQHQVPLRKVHVLGVGADSPMADNKTRDGRKQNRRVEVTVFALNLDAAPKQGTTAAAQD